MVQAEKNSRKIQALSQELATSDQSLKSAFTEIRNAVPKNVQEKLGHWELWTLQLKNQLTAWKVTTIPPPNVTSRGRTKIKEFFDSLATV